MLFLSATDAAVGDAIVVQGAASPDPAITAALAEFERRVLRAHAREVARAEREDPGAASEPAPSADTPAEGKPSLDRTPRVGLRSVLDRMAASIRWQVEQDSWSAGIRLRYSRSVEFDPETTSFALIEAVELTPAASYRVVALGRPMRILVRRTGYAEWSRALFAPPSRWLFFDRPNRLEEARRIEPGTEVVLSNEARFFIGPDYSTDLGEFPVGMHAGFFASGEYFVRMKRLPASLVEGPGCREWLVAVGGLITQGFESSLDVRTPEILWNKRFRVFDTQWRLQRGIKFRLRAGPLDLQSDPSIEPFFRAAVGGAAVFRLSDFQLLGKSVEMVFVKPKVGMDLLQELERISHFQEALTAARADEEAIPFVESVSHFSPRGHGSFGIGLWALVYGLSFGSDWYAEESMVVGPRDAPRTIHDFPFQRRWDRGWLLFPRETRDLQMVTVQDGESDDRITEISLEIEDAHARTNEGRAYRRQILRLLSQAIVDRFPARAGSGASQGPAVFRNELPDLTPAVAEHQKVSIYLRLILGPRFHVARTPEGGAPESREQQITRWQREISQTIRRRGDALETLIRTHGTEDLFVSFRIALTPYARRKETPRPTVEYLGSFGDPERIPSYRRLRDALDAAGATY